MYHKATDYTYHSSYDMLMVLIVAISTLINKAFIAR